jgi:hypothetical protein
MAIPEAQLETWAHQGSITQSADTYNTIKRVLERDGTPYAGKAVNVFLQGSYGNDTNIYSESDVDVVIQSNEAFYYDVSPMPAPEQAAFLAAYPHPATYGYAKFKEDVVKVLKAQYGNEVVVGPKAISIAANGSRRKADVIAAVQYRRYFSFKGYQNEHFEEGICFYTDDGTQIANYPRQHSANLTRKHQSSGEWFKPMARILKNARENMKGVKAIAADLAPSYYIEGLLYNVPPEQFRDSYSRTLDNCIAWLGAVDRSQFVCANEQYYLLREGYPVTWRETKCAQFIAALKNLRDRW